MLNHETITEIHLEISVLLHEGLHVLCKNNNYFKLFTLNYHYYLLRGKHQTMLVLAKPIVFLQIHLHIIG